jgi:hypothetical protein
MPRDPLTIVTARFFASCGFGLQVDVLDRDVPRDVEVDRPAS